MKTWIKVILFASLAMNLVVIGMAGIKIKQVHQIKQIKKNFEQENKIQWQEMKKCHRQYRFTRSEFFNQLTQEKFNQAKLDSLLNKMVAQKTNLEKNMGLRAIEARKKEGLEKFKKNHRLLKKFDKKNKRRLP